jgi:hypothetical protein
MVRRVFILSIAALLFIVPKTSSQNATKGVPENTNSSGTVKIKNCAKVFVAPDKTGLSVSYDYAFPGRSTVRISGLGEVPATGSFHYITLGKQLEFKDSTSGMLLARTPLVETVIVAAKPPLNQIPNDGDFQTAFRSFTWVSSQNLQERTDAVLSRYFRYLPREDHGTTFIATTFTQLQLEGSPHGVLGQVALLISFPYETIPGKYSFHIQTAIREGRSLSDEYRVTGDPTIIRAADSFVDGLVVEMRGSGRP